MPFLVKLTSVSLLLSCWLLISGCETTTSKSVGIDKSQIDKYQFEQGKTFNVQFEDITIRSQHTGNIDIRISYPQASTKAHPLIVFSHGHYLNNKSYHALTDEWVKRGYVVIAPRHLDSGDRETIAALGKRLGHDWISAARVLDIKAIINQVETIEDLTEFFSGKILTEKIIAAGHSFGALTAQILAGATLEQQGNSLYPIPNILRDDRVAAVVAISPPGLVPGAISKQTWERFSAPQLVVTGTNDVFEYIWQDYREHTVSYQAAEPGNNYLLVMDGMDHYMGNLIGRLNKDSAPQKQALDRVVERSLVFMETFLTSNMSDKANNESTLNNFKATLAQPGVVTYTRR